MLSRFVALRLAALGLLLFAAPSRGLEMRWASGRSGLVIQETATCTLVVRCSVPGEVLPEEMRILFAGESDSGDPVVAPGGADLGVAGVCAMEDTVTPADRISRTAVARLCTIDGVLRAREARFVVRIPSGFRGHFKVVPVGCGDTACPKDPFAVSEVTVNGGTSSPYPPLPVKAQSRMASGGVAVLVLGVGLDRVQTVHLRRESSDATFPVELIAKADTLLLGHATLVDITGEFLLEAVDSTGAIGAASIQLESVPPTVPMLATDYLLIRFRPNAAFSPRGEVGGALEEFAFSDGTLGGRLAQAGVIRLDRVFPWFAPEDVRSENFIGESIELEDLSQYYYATVVAGTDVGVSTRTLRDEPGVLWVGPDYGGTPAHFDPNDPLFVANQQWGMKNIGQVLCEQTTSSGVDIQATSAWDYTTGSPSVRVVVLDTGIDTTHSELLGRVRAGPPFVSPAVSTSWDDDPATHGTAGAGIIAAAGDNNNGIAGIAWEALPWAVKVLRSDGFSRASWVSQGISWATANGMPIISMAIGFPEVGCSGGGPPIPADSANIMNVACLNALYAGAASFASMGNCDVQVKQWPAAFEKRVYGVGALYLDGARWEDCRISPGLCGNCGFTNCLGSTFGPWIDAVTPGGHLIVTLGAGPNTFNEIGTTCGPNNGFVNMAFGGTSASAGFASGIAALLLSQEPCLLGEDITNLMNLTAAHPGVPRDNFVGYGRLQPAFALGRLTAPYRTFHHIIGPGTTSTCQGEASRVLRRAHYVSVRAAVLG